VPYRERAHALGKSHRVLKSRVSHAVEKRVSALRDLGADTVEHGDLGFEILSCGAVGHGPSVDCDHKGVGPCARNDLARVEPQSIQVFRGGVQLRIDTGAFGLSQALELPVADARAGESVERDGGFGV